MIDLLHRAREVGERAFRHFHHLANPERDLFLRLDLFFNRREPEIQAQLNNIIIVPPHITFTNRATLLYGDRTIELIYVGGHTPATSIVWLPDEGVCFVGDILWVDQHPYMAQGNTLEWLRALDLVPVAELQLTTETIKRFRLGYLEAFGAPAPDDLLYQAVSEGRRHPGMEHWLPLFHDRLDTLLDYLPGTAVVLEPLVEDAARERLGQVGDYHDARLQALARRDAGPPYRPLAPGRLHLAQAEWGARLDAAIKLYLVPLSVLGALMSSYHYYIERFPEAGGSCSVTVPCNTPWFEQWGFVTLAFMALTGFLAIIALLSVADPAPRSGDEPE